jgi:cytoskeletal protein CcmA (bactofilin family)
LAVGGDIEAKMIEAEGKIVCNTLKCENIKGDVTVNNEN